MTRTLFALFGSALLGATSLWGSTSYVPYSETTVDGVQWKTELVVTNLGDKNLRMRTTFIPAQTDGTDRDNLSSEFYTVPGGQTRVFVDLSQQEGLLEVSGDPLLAVSARMVSNSGTGNSVGASVPVLFSENLAPANGFVDLQGWSLIAERVTDFGIVNLGHEPAFCAAALFRATGEQLLVTQGLALAPLTLLHLANPLSFLAEVVGLGRATISCDQPFSAYARVRDEQRGDLNFVTPAASNSTLLRPDEVPPVPPPPSCTPGAVCYDFPGVVHTSTRGNPQRRITLSPPIAVYSQIKVHLEVEINGWSSPSTAAHGLLYLIRDKNRDQYASTFLRGPTRNLFTHRHGMNQLAEDKAKLEQGFSTPATGETLVLDYLYDPVGDRLVMTMRRDGEVVGELFDKPNVNRVHIEQGQNLIIDLSNPGSDPAEPASFGWVYKNLHLELIP